MARTYYTLLALDNGHWVVEFGDYDIDVVKDELLDIHESTLTPKSHMRIIASDDDQASIDAEVAKYTKQSPPPTKELQDIITFNPVILSPATRAELLRVIHNDYIAFVDNDSSSLSPRDYKECDAQFMALMAALRD